MMPRGPAAATAATTSSTDRGVRTRAREGAVRPQPCRLVSGPDVVIPELDIAARLRAPTILDDMSTPPDPRVCGSPTPTANGPRSACRSALSEGRITVSELDDRLAIVYAARYEAELRPPLADLPDPDAGVAAVAAPVPSNRAGPPTVLRSGMSSIRRTGSWSVPARLRVQSVMGSVLLDFSQAEIPHPVVEVELEMAAARPSCCCPTTPPPTSTA